ncbi:MAG: T9SS type A sorting domain-containing protein [Saprospiraceae bacterium]
MKHFLLLIFSLLYYSITAQIVLQPMMLPRVGDTLRTAMDNLPTNISLLASGADQRWDFTSLQSPFVRQTIVKSPDEGEKRAAFPTANMLIELAEGAEAYYRYVGGQQNTVQLSGLFGKDPLNLGLEVLTRYNPPLVERRAPLRYQDKNRLETAFTLPFSTDELPNAVLDQLPIRPDSLRIRIKIQRDDVVDSWGKVTIPGGIYDVLREKRVEVREVRIDARLGFLPWQDITDLIPNADLVGKDTTVYYYYFSNEAKEPIAVVTTNEDGKRAIRVEYKANDLTTDVQNLKTLKPGVYAFPNPAIVNVRFEFTNLAPGEYKLSIYNILGAEVWKQRYYINGQRIEKVDISNLRKGTYLYSLRDEWGKTIITKRLVVVRP